MNDTRILALANQKGGCGKSSTTINLGVSLAKQGLKVLIVDCDPQGNTTMALGYPQPDELDMTLAKLMAQEMPNQLTMDIKEIEYDNVILSSEGVDFIPANIELAALENILINSMSRENIFKRVLAHYQSKYQVILLDCPPSLNIMTINALTASDEVIIPVQAQYLSVKGLELLLQTISNVRKNLNTNLTIAGVLITMLDKRASFQKELIEVLNESYGQHIRIFESVIPMSVKVSELQSRGESILKLRGNKVAEGYENFAKELLGNEKF